MNRRKRGNDTLKKRAKRANAKLNPKNKASYIAKADREEPLHEELHPMLSTTSSGVQQPL